MTENQGREGKVRVYPPSLAKPDAFSFQWRYDEEKALLLIPAEERPDRDA